MKMPGHVLAAVLGTALSVPEGKARRVRKAEKKVVDKKKRAKRRQARASKQRNRR